jgi:hypothetical protein
MCLRDEEDNFMLAKTAWFSSLCAVDEGEAMCLYTTLEWVANLQFDNVDFILDSNKVVDYFRTCIDDRIEFGCIMYASKHMFQDSLQNSLIEFSRGQTNGITHELAKVTLCHASSNIYIDAPSYIRTVIYIDAPSCIRTVIDNEIN